MARSQARVTTRRRGRAAAHRGDGCRQPRPAGGSGRPASGPLRHPWRTRRRVHRDNGEPGSTQRNAENPEPMHW